jgi:DNA-binding NarL/FixJ family response regulator
VTGVVLAEDNRGVRDALIDLLNSAPDITVLGHCEDGDELLDCVERADPQVVLVDIAMPRVNGLEATRRLLAARPGTRVIVLTASLSAVLVREALDAGAVGYQLKGDDPADLLTAIRAVARGDTAWSRSAAALFPVG